MFFRTKDKLIDLLLKQLDDKEKELKEQRSRNDILVDRLLMKEKNVPAITPEVRTNYIDELMDDRDDAKDAIAHMSVVGQDFGEEDKTIKEE